LLATEAGAKYKFVGQEIQPITPRISDGGPQPNPAGTLSAGLKEEAKKDLKPTPADALLGPVLQPPADDPLSLLVPDIMSMGNDRPLVGTLLPSPFPEPEKKVAPAPAPTEPRQPSQPQLGPLPPTPTSDNLLDFLSVNESGLPKMDTANSSDFTITALRQEVKSYEIAKPDGGWLVLPPDTSKEEIRKIQEKFVREYLHTNLPNGGVTTYGAMLIERQGENKIATVQLPDGSQRSLTIPEDVTRRYYKAYASTGNRADGEKVLKEYLRQAYSGALQPAESWHPPMALPQPETRSTPAPTAAAAALPAAANLASPAAATAPAALEDITSTKTAKVSTAGPLLSPRPT